MNVHPHSAMLSITEILKNYKRYNIDINDYIKQDILLFDNSNQSILLNSQHIINIPIILDDVVIFKPMIVNINSMSGIVNFSISEDIVNICKYKMNINNIFYPLSLTELVKNKHITDKINLNIINYTDLNIQNCFKYTDTFTVGYDAQKSSEKISSKGYLMYIKNQLSLPKYRPANDIVYLYNNNFNYCVQNKIFDETDISNVPFRGTVYVYISIFTYDVINPLSFKECYVYFQVKQKNYLDNVVDFIVCDSMLIKLSSVKK